MWKTKHRLLRYLQLVAGGAVLLQTQCSLDPDLFLRSGVSLGSDVAIFLLENLVRGI